MTTTTLWILAVVGGILPDAIRILKETRADKKVQLNWVSMIIQIALGVLAVWIIMILPLEGNDPMSSDAIKALGLGYAAPDLLTSAIAAANKPQALPTSREGDEDQEELAGAPRSSVSNSTTHTDKGLMSWWRI